MEYEGDNALYFANGAIQDLKSGDSGSTRMQKDSISQSFFLLGSVTQDIVYVQVNTMGHIADIDRPISIVQTNTGQNDAAIAGIHYLPFDDPEIKKLMVIPAGREWGQFPVVLLRDESLEQNVMRLEIGIGTNEYFRPGIDKQRNFLIKITALASKPTNWDTNWYIYFGRSWGPVKMRFIIDVTGFTDWDSSNSDSNYNRYMESLVKQKFLEYNDAYPENPLKEADGTLVIFDH
ncbi:MAG: DUF4843 domain-containing protein [Bacteroides intestinalis]|nr:DUF4843 domain-containing protein [Bacteroides intestinalis]